MPAAPAPAPAPAPALAPAAPLFVVLNRGSGRGSADETRQAIEAACRAAGRPLTLRVVGQGRRVPDLAREAVESALAQGGIAVAAGGDGTINAVAHAALRAGCAFGVLPQGTFNYFSRVHGIPAPIEESLQSLLTGTPQPVQAGEVNDRAFLVNASLGLYARMLEEREDFKARFGRRRWVAFGAALATLLKGFRTWTLNVSAGGGTQVLRTPTLFVGNNALQFEQVGVEEGQAVEEGGALAAIALEPLGRLAMIGLVLRAALGRLGSASKVRSFTFREIEVQAATGASSGRRRVRVATDGEVQWMDMPLRFRVSPRPLWLVKPLDARAERA
ncbi:diacylglycerol kinase family protein [uncultured Pseudacidovorax sp.]|uniref:diacylglycerol/lipid kinase family protein n=1 Tax=uncultured Pseudacidovorax sp. TaxID=679313 RepID=UPI0025DC186A|nr:diacylglycerol kinase family protein [uncultured Pseudacidovorax sp.]